MDRNKTAAEYFAAANSGRGFVSFFEEIFGGLDRLYVIKGGSGTGKSRMMAEVAAAAENRGLEAERYYCSADAGSLDGILIPGLSAGMIDGTAPHVRDPRYPGAVDEIVNVGQFWDACALREKRDEIKRICGGKSEAFERAFGVLKAAYDADLVIRGVEAQRILHGKLNRAAERLAKSFPKGPGGNVGIRVLDAFTMRGRAHKNTFAEKAEKLYKVTGRHGAAPAFLDRLCELAAAKGQPVLRAVDPLNVSVTVELFLPLADVAFVRDCGERVPVSVVNTDRFSDREEAKKERKALTMLKAKRRELIDCAEGFLSEAAELHFALEEIYSAAMDFGAKERLTRSIIDDLFG